jgi:hypothetical protein
MYEPPEALRMLETIRERLELANYELALFGDELPATEMDRGFWQVKQNRDATRGAVLIEAWSEGRRPGLVVKNLPQLVMGFADRHAQLWEQIASQWRDRKLL